MLTRLLRSFRRPSFHSGSFRQRSFALLFCLPVAAGSFAIIADDGVRPATQQIRSEIEKQQQQRSEVEKQISLKKAATEISQGRVAELQKLLDEAQKRAEAEQGEFSKAHEQQQALETQLASLTEQLRQHETADGLEQAARAAQGRLDQLVGARTELEKKMAALRKSSVEFQSKAVESEQQVNALEAQRADLQKAATDSKTALDAADQQLTAASTALAAAAAALETQTTAVAAEQQRIDSATVSSQKLAESLLALQKSLDSLKEAARVMGVNSDEAINGLSAAITELQPLQKNTDALIQQVTLQRDALKPQFDAAKAEFDKKQAEQTAAAEGQKKAAEAFQTASTKIPALDAQQTALRTVAAEARAAQQIVNDQMMSLEPSVQKLAAEVQLVRTETVAQQKLAEAAMEPLGRFVSFSRSVAPIMAKHCVACHNTRSPGGRLNLDSWAALNKGGESGAALEAHKSSESLLLSMVTDGSMPKDADPLSEQEISIIRQWIDVGAPLDAGLIAGAELFDVMPESAQPMPPSSYRVAIPVTATAFSPDGSLLATSGYHEILLWKTDDGSLLRRITNVAERVYDIEFSKDGLLVAVAAGTPGQLGEVKLFSAADGSLQRTLVRAKDAVFAVSYSPDGTKIASGGADRSIIVVQVEDGAVVRRIEDHADWVMDINWSPDGVSLVSSSRDKTSKIFNASTGDPQITFGGHGEPVYSAAFLSDGKTVVSGGGDDKIRVWNTADAKELRAIAGIGGDVFRILVIAGDHILSASADRNVREHNAGDGALLRTMSGHADWVYTLAFSPGRNLMASGSYDGEIRVWNSTDGTMQTSFIAIPKDNSAGNATALAQ